MPLLLAQLDPAGSSPGEALPAAEMVNYRLGRLEQIDDPRLLWAGVALVAIALCLFVVWQYWRESEALPRWTSLCLASLRLLAFAGAIVFYLAPIKRTDLQMVAESRVAVLVDASQSMAVQDEQVGEQSGLSRSEAVLRTLRDSPFIAQLREQHDVTLAVFDADVRRVAAWKRTHEQSSLSEVEQPSSTPPEGDDSLAAADSPKLAPTDLQGLEPLGAETRLGDALSQVLADASGGPLAGVFTFSDGGQNLGVDPLAVADVAAAAKAPLVTIGVGSTEPRRNLRLQELIAPSRAYPNDKVVIRALVQGEGYAGRTVDVELHAGQSQSGDTSDTAGPAVRIGQEQATIEEDGKAVAVAFEIEPAEVGRLELQARILAPEDDQYAEDNQRTTEMEVVETSTRVLLIASGAARDYRFLRDQLRRDEHVTVDVLLQMSPPGISQDADKILTEFPSTKEELFEYDCIVAFDPEWTRLDAAQVDLLEQWVADEAGGLIVVAGPVHTGGWLQSPEHLKIRALYPVEFQRRLTLLDDGLYGSESPWPIEFTREGLEADFLWIGDTPEESRSRWKSFPGVFGAYAVRGPKPGAQIYGRYGDPEAGVSQERPAYFADHFYGAGRVFFMGSGELYRLRSLDTSYFERLYTQLIRHVSQGRLLRGSSTARLLVERDRYFIGDTVVVRAQLSTASREPYVADKIAVRIDWPGGRSTGESIELLADESRPGTFIGQFTASKEGSYRIELQAPDKPDEQLVKRITATAPDLEFEETRRNEALLTALATRTGGRYYSTPQEAIEGAGGVPPAAQLLESRAETRTLRGKPDPAFTESLNQWLLGVICGALCLEWLLRRLMKLA